MANVITFNQVVDILKDIATRHYQINSFFLGRDWEVENNQDVVYPLLQVYPEFSRMPITNGEYKTLEFTMNCKILDLVKQGEQNEQAVQSDCLRIGQDVVNELNQHPFYTRSNASMIGDVDFTSLEEFNDDFTAGWQFNINLRLINHNSYCGLPFEDIAGYSASGPDFTGFSYSVQYLTCQTVTACTSLQTYVGSAFVSGFYTASSSTLTFGTINGSIYNVSGITSSGSGGGFSGWTASTGLNSIIANNGSGNVAPSAFTLVGGRNNNANGYASVIAGGESNITTGTSASIVGGQYNSVLADNSAIINGTQNKITQQMTFIGGGYANSGLSEYSSIVGGYKNLVSGNYSSVLAGKNNIVTGSYSSVLAGNAITASTNNAAYVPFLFVKSASTDSITNTFLVRDSTGEVKTRHISGVTSGITSSASNGLNTTGGTIQLGGTLIKNTTIDGGANSLHILGLDELHVTADNDFTFGSDTGNINLTSGSGNLVFSGVQATFHNPIIVNSGVTVVGDSVFRNNLSATSITADTYYNIPTVFGSGTNGNGGTVNTGVTGYVTMGHSGRITGWDLVGAPSGSCVMDIWKTSGNTLPTVLNSITDSNKPRINGGFYSGSTTLTNWTGTTYTTGSIFAFNMDSVSEFTNVTLTLRGFKQ